jgi:hypothetical protein
MVTRLAPLIPGASRSTALVKSRWEALEDSGRISTLTTWNTETWKTSILDELAASAPTIKQPVEYTTDVEFVPADNILIRPGSSQEHSYVNLRYLSAAHTGKWAASGVIPVPVFKYKDTYYIADDGNHRRNSAKSVQSIYDRDLPSSERKVTCVPIIDISPFINVSFEGSRMKVSRNLGKVTPSGIVGNLPPRPDINNSDEDNFYGFN